MSEIALNAPAARYTRDRRKLLDRIRRAPLRIPPTVPADAAACIAGLLRRRPGGADAFCRGASTVAASSSCNFEYVPRRHPRQRLCCAAGAEQLQAQPFFRELDFDALVLGAVEPPIKPCAGLKRPARAGAPLEKLTLPPRRAPSAPQAHFANFDNKFTVLPVDTPADGDLPAFLVGDDDDFPDWEFSRS